MDLSALARPEPGRAVSGLTEWLSPLEAERSRRLKARLAATFSKKQSAGLLGSVGYPQEREHVEYAIGEAAHAAVFGSLCVLDGACVIDDGAGRDHFELHYINGSSDSLLASSAGELPVAPLHESLWH